MFFEMYLIGTDVACRLELNTRGFDVEVEIAAQTATSGRVTEAPIASTPHLKWSGRVPGWPRRLGSGLQVAYVGSNPTPGSIFV